MSGDQKLPRVVIICSFAGLNTARALRRGPVEIVLIDRTNHHNKILKAFELAEVESDPVGIPAHPLSVSF